MSQVFNADFEAPQKCPKCQCFATGRISPTAHYCQHCKEVFDCGKKSKKALVSCFSCETEFVLDENNNRPEGYFCNRCLGMSSGFAE